MSTENIAQEENIETQIEKRRRYKRDWQRRYRARLADQGIKQIRVYVHRDFEAELREIARKDIEDRL